MLSWPLAVQLIAVTLVVPNTTTVIARDVSLTSTWLVRLGHVAKHHGCGALVARIAIC